MGWGTRRLAGRQPEPALPPGGAGGGGLSRRRAPKRLPGLVDSHAHLQHERFADDLDEVLERARDAGIERILVPGWDLASSEAALELVERHAPLIAAAVGVHPHHAAELDEGGWQQLAALARDPRASAVGEIGLDYFRNLSPPDVQREAFARQLTMAAEAGLPLLVHDRDAHDDVTDALLAWPGPPRREVRGVLHAFSGDAAMASRLVGAGFLVSFALPVAFRSAAGPRAAAPVLHGGSFLVETDAPYLGPDRERRNEPVTALRVVAELAALRDATVESLVEPIRATYERLLGRT
jgi:TatD DNase family protein